MMLVLSRKIGEQIVIDGRIRVTLVKVMGNRVRLGIEAPNSIQIMRSEIMDDVGVTDECITCLRG